MKCVICKTNEANQKHHVSYEPEELVIDICKQCHQKIHQGHGVGNGLGEKQHKESKENQPFFTYMIYGEHGKLIKDSETDESLINLTCSCNNPKFELYGRLDESALYICCSKCGFDRRITVLEAKITDGIIRIEQPEVNQTKQV
jgi:hypothetical protein